MAFVETRPTESAVIIPKRQYRGRIIEASTRMITPDPKLLKPGESDEEFPAFFLKIEIPQRGKEPLIYEAKLYDKPGRGPKAGLSKFYAACGKPGARGMDVDFLVSHVMEFMLEDQGPTSSSPLNWVSDWFTAEDKEGNPIYPPDELFARPAARVGTNGGPHRLAPVVTDDPDSDEAEVPF